MALSRSAEGKQVGSTTGATEVVRKNGIKKKEENILEEEKNDGDKQSTVPCKTVNNGLKTLK